VYRLYQLLFDMSRRKDAQSYSHDAAPHCPSPSLPLSSAPCSQTPSADRHCVCLSKVPSNISAVWADKLWVRRQQIA